MFHSFLQRASVLIISELVSGSIHAARVTYQILRPNIKFPTKLGFSGEMLKLTVLNLPIIIHQTKNVAQP